MSDQTVAPVTKAARVQSLDVLRGISLLGILMMNITAFGLLFAAYGNPAAGGGASGVDLTTFWIIQVGFEGTMRGIFSILFGAGIVLLTGRMEDAGAGLMAAEIHFRRMMWMMLFGVIHWALLLWTGEILFMYSICGMLLFAPRKLPARVQIAAAAVLLIFAALMQSGDYVAAQSAHKAYAEAQAVEASGKPLSKEQQAAIDDWKQHESHYYPSEDDKALLRDAHSGSWLNAVGAQLPGSFAFQWIGAPFWIVFDVVPFMLLGMALLKLGVLGAKLEPKSYALMALIGYGVGLPLGWYETNLVVSSQFATLAFVEADRTYELSRLATTLGHFGLALLVIRLGLFQTAQRALAAVGQMALTNYIAQTLICTALFYGFGFGLYEQFARHELYYVVAAIWVVELVWSSLWLKRYRFGPMEWLWRSLTYWQPQPMRL